MSTPPTPSDPLWFTAVCDSLYNKITWWRDNYERGDVSRTRQRLNEHAQVENVPVQYAIKIPWHQRELDHLVRILKATGAQDSLVEDLETVRVGLRKAPTLAGGLHVTTMAFWKDDVVEILRCLDKAKGATSAIDDYLRSQEGKPRLFRV